MNKKSTTKKLFFLTIILLISVTSVFSQQNIKRLGKSGFTFLKLSPSARAAALGDAYTAIANDAYAIFYNPAGLTQINKFAYGFTYGKWIVDSRLMSFAGAYKFGRSTVGLSVISFAPPDFEETTIYESEGTGRMINVGDIAFGAAYAIELTDKLSFGVKANYVEETIDRDKATGLMLDLSTFYRTGFKDLVLAMAMKNFGPDRKFINEKFKMPLLFNINIAMNFIGKHGDPFVMKVSTESCFATDYKDRYHVGAEVWLLDKLALRGGYKFYYDLEDYSFGAGFKINVAGKPISIDVAYSNVLSYFEAPLRFSIGGEF
ncbi:PorV/PorQ family protein [candidate division KSB1 bacterium]|nr:PorV/PorQ family protein [candidate division KSB1 bacterium]